MPAFVSFLRAINVGGRNMIRMDALKALHESLGYKDVRTHLQSGNVVFRAKSADAAKIEKAIKKAFDADISVIVRSTGELRAAVEANPFPKRAAEANRFVVVFLSGQPSGDLESYTGPEEKQIVGRELYIYYSGDMARSKLTNALIERKLGVKGTARNWNTVNKMLELAEALEA
jgi:uncharacterized protein (DUF1697 family)